MSTLSHQSRVELARLRASVTLDPSSFLHPVVKHSDREDGGTEWMPDISEPEDVGLQATPEVAVYTSVQYDEQPLHDPSAPPIYRDAPGIGKPYRVMRRGEGSEGLALRTNPRAVDENYTAQKIRLHMDDAEFAYVTRSEDDNSILLRWNQPDDVLDELDSIERDEARNVWVERMTAFREAQLRRLLKEYFGTAQYLDREIVLKWGRVNGRWTPTEKMVVREWVAQMIEEKGSRLAGFASCAGTVRSKLTRRRVGHEGSALWTKTYNTV